MKSMVKVSLLALLFYFPCELNAQKDSLQKDSVWLQCPLNDASVVPPPKSAIQWDEPDLCIVIQSVPDTVAKACYAGRVSNVQMNEEGKWDVVFYFKDYYFWYAGLEKVLVKKNENLKAGQAIGYIAKGGRMEMLLFKFETPLDPTKYLNCKNGLQ
jgi:Peptidase family M23